MRIVTVLIVVAGCGGSIDPASDPGSNDASQIDTAPMTNPAVERALAWVDAKVPYCQAPNHQHDADTDCASTCTRPNNPEWDPYRSDCSGLVSWAWALPPPGRTTATLAPFDTTVSMAIDAAQLQPGDAINNDHHTMLFADWITDGVEAHFIEEPGCATTQPYAREIDANVTLSGQMITVESRGDYTAIRYVP